MSGPAYLYIDTRTIKPPYGVLSLNEIKHASHNKLNGCEWAVYLTIVCIVSGRPWKDGARIGLKQLMSSTGFSKSQIYKAIKKLNELKILETEKHKYKLLSPKENEILDEAAVTNSEISGPESIIEKVKNQNSACEEPVNNSDSSLEFEKKEAKNESRIRDHAINSNYKDSNYFYKAAKVDDNSKFRILLKFLDQHLISYEHSARVCLLDQFESSEITQTMIQNWILDFWGTHPEEIADELTNKRPRNPGEKPKRCLLSEWGWGYSTAPSTVRKWILRYIEYREIK